MKMRLFEKFQDIWTVAIIIRYEGKGLVRYNEKGSEYVSLP